MSNKFYIPKNMKVGFQKRDGTFDGKLSYVICYDEKGKLRKERSWNSWRDNTIEPIEIENTPVSGLSLNKSVRRYGYHFGGGRNMIRIYDPRGFEYEITPDNLIGILNHIDVLKGELQGEFVYSWAGADLVLLPVNSEQYKAAVQHTSNLHIKMSAKDLSPGTIYETKNGENKLYLGRFVFNREVFKETNALGRNSIKVSKEHVFLDYPVSNNKHHYTSTPVSSIGNTAGAIDKDELNSFINTFLTSPSSSEIDSYISKMDFTINDLYPIWNGGYYFKKNDSNEIYNVSPYHIESFLLYKSNDFLPFRITSILIGDDNLSTSKEVDIETYSHSFHRKIYSSPQNKMNDLNSSFREIFNGEEATGKFFDKIARKFLFDYMQKNNWGLVFFKFKNGLVRSIKDPFD